MQQRGERGRKDPFPPARGGFQSLFTKESLKPYGCWYEVKHPMGAYGI